MLLWAVKVHEIAFSGSSATEISLLFVFRSPDDDVAVAGEAEVQDDESRNDQTNAKTKMSVEKAKVNIFQLVSLYDSFSHPFHERSTTFLF